MEHENVRIIKGQIFFHTRNADGLQLLWLLEVRISSHMPSLHSARIKTLVISSANDTTKSEPHGVGTSA